MYSIAYDFVIQYLSSSINCCSSDEQQHSINTFITQLSCKNVKKNERVITVSGNTLHNYSAIYLLTLKVCKINTFEALLEFFDINVVDSAMNAKQTDET